MGLMKSISLLDVAWRDAVLPEDFAEYLSFAPDQHRPAFHQGLQARAA
jgi:hypothetical protein